MVSIRIIHFGLPGFTKALTTPVCNQSNQHMTHDDIPECTQEAWAATCKNCQRTDAWRKAMRNAPESLLGEALT